RELAAAGARLALVGLEPERLRALASGSRIRLLPPIPSTEVQPLLAAQYDALMAPSQWLETGPLVVLEAFAAGLPVIGSNLGGIAELVTSGTDGLLVEPADTGAWTAAMVRLASEPGLLERLREGVRPPKTMADVAIEMEGLYQRLAPAGAAAH
ncbi:MAG TPA: hypothetical protein DEH78_24480, partial [Solibacterales bacterium]|nr:hypothetical protein [Bryobacterales bacterium]